MEVEKVVGNTDLVEVGSEEVDLEEKMGDDLEVVVKVEVVGAKVVGLG